MTVDKEKITLTGAANLSNPNIDFNKLLTVTNETSSPVTVDAKVKIIDASTRTKAITIAGNKLDNTIFGGSKADSIYGAAGDDKLYGGKGNDSLWGGAGNDSLYGGSGNDTFIYKPNEGTDTIFDYQSGDMLKILNSDGTNGSFKKSKYSGDTLTLAINGGGKVIFDNVSATDTFNINGTTYKISGTKLK